MGIGGCDTLCSRERVELGARLPIGADMRLLRDGEVVATRRGSELHLGVTEPGAYRLEAQRLGRPWLFTNPIVLAPA